MWVPCDMQLKFVAAETLQTRFSLHFVQLNNWETLEFGLKLSGLLATVA